MGDDILCVNDDIIVVDKFEVDLKKKKVTHKNRKETKDLRAWFDEEIGYGVLDKHHM